MLNVQAPEKRWTSALCSSENRASEPFRFLGVRRAYTSCMRAAFAFLLNDPIHNALRKLSVDVHHRYGMGLVGAQLPPHVSLKQPFRISDLPAIEAYFDGFAATVPPLVLTLMHLDVQMQVQGQQEQVVLWADVCETPELRSLHQRLNAELAQHFADTAAPFDGPAYQFHATVALAALPVGAHRQILADYGTRRVDLSCVPRGLALFYYDDDQGAPGSYITYKVAPVQPRVSA